MSNSHTVTLVGCYEKVHYPHLHTGKTVYSNLIVNFVRGIQWPATAVKDKYVIGVYEYLPLTSSLREIIGPIKVNGKTIEVVDITDVQAAKDCHVVFIPAYKAKALQPLLTTISNDPKLIITNKMDLSKRGSGINFVLSNGKLGYEINCKAIEKRGLKVSNGIKNMGTIVE
jgi:hypothetical protein